MHILALSEQNLNEKIIRFFFFLATFILSYLVVHHIVYQEVQSDLSVHASFIPAMLNGDKVIPHFLWHFLVLSFSKLTGATLLNGGIAITVLAITLLSLIKYACFNFFLKDRCHYLFILLLTAISMIIMPFYIPVFNPNLYLGQGGVGIWHNPTLILVKPLAFLSVLSSLYYLKKKTRGALILSLLSTIISIFAKPNFVLVFIPSLFIYCFLMRTCYHFNKQRIGLLSSIVLSGFLVLAAQYYFTYTSSNKGVIVNFGAVWRYYSPSILISLLITLAFPVLVALGSKSRSDYFIFSWLLVSMGAFICFTFCETFDGVNAALDGNFFWGYFCAIDLLFTFAIIQYVSHYSEYNKPFAFCCNSVLVYHSISGIIYLKHILLNNSIA